jgi:quercetin dioxygenase-like cupin family protein
MSQTKTDICLVALLCFLFMIRCNENKTNTQENLSDSTPIGPTTSETSDIPAYDANMDAYNTGGDAVEKLGDSLGIKMYIVTIKPGDSAALHTHPDHTAYILQGGKLAVTFEGIGRQEMDLKIGQTIIGGPLSDAAKNIGNTTVKMLIHDIYRPRPK